MQSYNLSFSFLMPPTIFIVLAVVGVFAGLRWRRLGVALSLVSALALYAFSTPLVSSWLLECAARLPGSLYPPLSTAQAIVVLSGDIRRGGGPGNADQPGPLTDERLIEAARLYRALHLPILVTGGHAVNSAKSLAELMSETLAGAFDVPVEWQDEQASTTYENAQFAAGLLRMKGLSTVIVVTQAWHMPRALWSFERAGLHAIPAAASVLPHPPFRVFDLFPAHDGLERSFDALHELLGQAYYRWRYA